MIGNYYYGTGRRKTSVARVFIKAGKGQMDDYSRAHLEDLQDRSKKALNAVHVTR